MVLLSYLTSTALFVLLILSFLHPITAITQDLGRHILTGTIIVQTHHVPKINLFSYTYSQFPFINHHWFSEVIFYLVVKAIGFSGLLFVTTSVVFLSFILLFFYAKQKSSFIALLIPALLYFPILFERTDVRPEIFSFLFLAIFIVILYRYRERYTQWIFLLIPLELLWVNMHIYFFIGIIVLGLFCVDSILIHKHILFSKRVLTLFAVTVTCSFITILNPNGIPGALLPFTVLQHYGYSIEENQNIFFLLSLTQNIHIYFFVLAVGLLLINLLVDWRKTQPIDWFMSITFSVLGAWAIRNFPLFFFVTYIPFTQSFSHNGGRIFSLLQKKKPKALPLIRILLLFGIFGILLWQIISLFLSHSIGFALATGGESAANFYLTHQIRGPVFNNFDIGSYVEYRLYPRQKVFVDGRPEAYPVSFFQNSYIPMQEDPAIFQKADKHYHFNSIFFSHTDQTPWATQFIKDIIHNHDWKIVYLDSYSVIFVKNTTENNKLLQKYAMDEKTIHVTDFPFTNINDLVSLAHFYDEAGWMDQEANIYQKILAINPTYCLALYNYGLILQQQQLFVATAYLERYNQSCK